MSTFSQWTQAEVEQHNARVQPANRIPPSAPDPSPESKLHEQIIAFCKQRGWYYVHSRMDKPTTTQKGVVDFVIAIPGAQTLWVEAKGAKTKITREQAGTLHWLGTLGHRTAVVRSLAEFMAWVRF
jgi:hypothetical protein